MAAAAAAAAAAALPFAAAQTAVIVGGEFTEAGGVATQNLAQWNGNAWSRLNGPPMADGIVWSLATYQGKLVAAGRYNQIGTETFKNIAQFDGYQWAPLGTGIELVLVPPYTADVRALTVYRDQLIAGGLFDTAGGVLASGAAAWDGASWSALGEGVNNEIFALAVYNDALYAGGEFFTAGGSTARYIAKWDGAAWSPLGEGITTQGGKVYALLVYDGALIVGGEFESAGNVPASNIARWDGSAWSALGGGVTSPVGPFAPSVNSLTIFQGDLVLAGRFQGAEGQSLNRIARWNGTAYSPMGDGFNDEVNVVIAYEDTVIAGGRFGQSGSKDIYQIASWDGAEWHDMGFQDEYISYTWFHAMVLISAAGTDADACAAESARAARGRLTHASSFRGRGLSGGSPRCVLAGRPGLARAVHGRGGRAGGGRPAVPGQRLLRADAHGLPAPGVRHGQPDPLDRLVAGDLPDRPRALVRHLHAVDRLPQLRVGGPGRAAVQVLRGLRRPHHPRAGRRGPAHLLPARQVTSPLARPAPARTRRHVVGCSYPCMPRVRRPRRLHPPLAIVLVQKPDRCGVDMRCLAAAVGRP